MSDPSRARILVAFGLVYVIWGSTYLGIKLAIETMPPLTMAGVRFLVAGTILYLVLRARGAARPERVHGRDAGICGALLLFGGNGALVWAQQTVPSGLAAVLVAVVPIWIVVLEWLGRDRTRPSAYVLAGLALGLAGIIVLVGPRELAGGERVDPWGAGLIMLGTLSWAMGSLYARRARTPTAPLLATAMQMLVGGALLTVGGAVAGDWQALDPATFSATSIAAFAYLVVFGSLVAFSAYVWLLRASTPTKVSTYAFVNPVVAVLLGWVVANEPLTIRTLLASALVITAVASIVLGKAVRDGWRRPSDVPQEVV